MSPSESQFMAPVIGFPRTRGDEPLSSLPETALKAFSPHTRG